MNAPVKITGTIALPNEFTNWDSGLPRYLCLDLTVTPVASEPDEVGEDELAHRSLDRIEKEGYFSSHGVGSHPLGWEVLCRNIRAALAKRRGG